MARALQRVARMGLGLALVLALASVEIAGDAACPDADSVRAELARLGALDSPGRLVITRTVDAVSVELRSSSGRVIGQRSLPVRAECSELASAVAVLVATWESELAADPLPPSAPAIVARTGARPLAFRIAGGLLGMAGRDARGLGGMVAATAGRAANRWVLEGSLGATQYEAQPLGRGEVGWVRVMLGVGGQLRARPGAIVIAARAAAVAGLLHASARGYESNRSETAVSPGLAGGVRVQIGRGRVTPYLDVGGVAWIRRDHLLISGVAGEIALPRFELALALGVASGGP